MSFPSTDSVSLQPRPFTISLIPIPQYFPHPRPLTISLMSHSFIQFPHPPTPLSQHFPHAPPPPPPHPSSSSLAYLLFPLWSPCHLEDNVFGYPGLVMVNVQEVMSLTECSSCKCQLCINKLLLFFVVLCFSFKSECSCKRRSSCCICGPGNIQLWMLQKRLTFL